MDHQLSRAALRELLRGTGVVAPPPTPVPVAELLLWGGLWLGHTAVAIGLGLRLWQAAG